MAITRIDSLQGQATGDGSGQFDISLAGLTLAQGDLLIIGVAAVYITADIDLSASGDNSGACTELADLYRLEERDVNFWLGHALQGATADTSITISGTMFATKCAYVVVQYRGVDASSVLDVAVQTATGANTAVTDPPSITPVSPGAKIIVAYCCTYDTTGAWNAPSDVDNYTVQSDSSAQCRLALADKSWTSGAFDPAALTPTTDNVQNGWAAVTLALRSGERLISAPLLTNSQTFHSPTLTGGADIGVPLLANEQAFHSPTVTPGPVTLIHSLVENEQVFYGATATPGAVTLAVKLYDTGSGPLTPVVANDRSWVRNRRRRAKQIDYEMPIRRNIRR